LQQGYLQQNLQTLAGQSITLPQVAMAAQHFQHLQDSNQNVISSTSQQQLTQLLQHHLQQQSNQSLTKSQLNSNSLLSSPNHLNSSNHPTSSIHKASVTAAQLSQQLSPNNKRNLNSEDRPNLTKPSITSNHSLNHSHDASPGAPFSIKNRPDPSSEEMTDLEELEQFAKMFKQRRIKLGKLYIIHLHLVTSCHSRLLFFVY
jgi:POU domain protein 2 (fragment)